MSDPGGELDLGQAVALGVVQGLTEFLPISSTAHLRIVPALMGWDDPGAATSAVIQLGTVGAVVAYFRNDLAALTRGFVDGLRAGKPFGTEPSRLAWYVGLGTIPIGVLGLALKPFIETTFRSLWVIGGALIALAVVLGVAERVAAHRRTISEMTLKDALLIGLWQALALVPGSSRSGSTLAGALFAGFTRYEAARYTFLLSIPATTLAGVFELKHLLEAPSRPPAVMLAVATFVSFLTGLGAIWGLLTLLRTRTTLVFVVYRLALGAAILGLLAAGVLQP